MVLFTRISPDWRAAFTFGITTSESGGLRSIWTVGRVKNSFADWPAKPMLILRHVRGVTWRIGAYRTRTFAPSTNGSCLRAYHRSGTLDHGQITRHRIWSTWRWGGS